MFQTRCEGGGRLLCDELLIKISNEMCFVYMLLQLEDK